MIRRLAKKWRVPLIVLGLAVAACIAVGIIMYALAQEQMGANAHGTRLERMLVCPNFKEGKFVNTLPTNMISPGQFIETGRMYLETSDRNPRKPIPTERIAAGFFAQAPVGGLRVTWLGHSAFIIELDGALILTDPVLFSRASPFSWIGSERFFPCPVAMADLPEFDAVVISHDHYDHLALDEVRALIPKTKKFIVALGIGAHLERWGVPPEKIVELSWWEEAVIGNGVRVLAAPARHFSGRAFRRDPTLWASVILIGPRHSVFFSGDSGMTPEFSDIGQRFGPFDCTLIKMGAYGRTWPDIHVTPEQALEVHRLVRGKVFIPAHWATYNLAAHSWYEPVDRLLAAASGTDVNVIVPKPGQPVVPDGSPPLVRWWDVLR